MKRVIITALCVLLFGCAGTPFKWGSARQIKSGMTPTEVTQIMGAPYSVTASGEKLIYTWVDVNSLTMSTKSLAVVFIDGKVKQAPVIPPDYQ
ncbi:hypothetical protein [Paludibacterium purpuratum]|uniref:Lipoprotein SmpA/OmlA domain-containing protein n=1 Tax=Paludibacterium purpuratum TaxID=1144873 RepID=A0A4R7BBD0_9NEIS|nr:hypothetical protein [Paludibacterium purpuratum]TDR82208.1 hypothetical protein DFP86_102322 [Paludibacterium purpuratum]